MELAEALRRRRMVRAFDDRPVAPEVLDRILDAGRRGPSAGSSQSLDLLVLDDRAGIDRYWETTMPDPERRASFRWPGLLRAPVLVVPYVSAADYAARYAEPDKASTGLGDQAAWSVPYWWIDGGIAVGFLLLAVVDEGLGACLFGQFEHESSVRTAFGVPDDRRALGTIAIGHPAPDEPGRSAGRRRRPLDEVVHRGRW